LPINRGPARGQLIFELATKSECQQSIPLFAYGGHYILRIAGVQKGPIGPAFVSMGQVKMLKTMEQKIKLTNDGTLPGFASLIFDNTKWFNITLDPSEARLAPGESVEINIRFKANKEEVRKIIHLNKEITIVGEICIISGDEPTRLRLLNSKDNVPQRFLAFLPKKLPGEIELKRELVLFNESLDGSKLTSIMEQIKTHEIALTVCRDLDETQIVAAELSTADESSLTFETFCETNCNRTEHEARWLHETVRNDPGYV
jgi:hypothetical protein